MLFVFEHRVEKVQREGSVKDQSVVLDLNRSLVNYILDNPRLVAMLVEHQGRPPIADFMQRRSRHKYPLQICRGQGRLVQQLSSTISVGHCSSCAGGVFRGGGFHPLLVFLSHEASPTPPKHGLFLVFYPPSS